MYNIYIYIYVGAIFMDIYIYIYIYIYTCSSFGHHGGRFSRSPGAAQMVADTDASQLPSRPPLVSTRGGPVGGRVPTARGMETTF